MGILNEKDAQGAKAAADELAKVRTNMFSEKFKISRNQKTRI